MKSISEEIEKLRKNKPYELDEQNSNRYRIVVSEDDNTKTAYYFSAPIYNIHNGKIINLKYLKNSNGIFCLECSSAKAEIYNKIKLQNGDGCISIPLSNTAYQLTENELLCNKDLISPTTNGVVYKAKFTDKEKHTFNLKVVKPFMEIRANDKCFSLMSEKFRPFMTISCIGVLDNKENIIAPAKLSYKKLDEYTFEFTITSTCKSGEYIAFEVNLYEPKLIQDTTVESGNVKQNNAFGSMAFLGLTESFGLQWLYSRLDYSRFSDIMGKKINCATFHIPNYNYESGEISASIVAARFCSFGSNWENRITQSSYMGDSCKIDEYEDIDILPLLTEEKTKQMVLSNGLILKPKVKSEKFIAISTGDSCYRPQIIEINYEK